MVSCIAARQRLRSPDSAKNQVDLRRYITDVRQLSTMRSSSSHVPQQVRFDPTQNSLVFINCCFAISLGGPILVLGDIQNNASGHWGQLLPGVPLAIWLTFSVWRQYT